MWNTNANLVTLSHSMYSCQLDTEAPERGLFGLQVDEFSVPVSLLQVHAPITPHIDDTYVRGNDLVVAYHHSGNVRPQVNWSADSIGDGRGIQVAATLSMQTNLLLSDPQSRVTSEFPASEVHTLKDGEATLVSRWTEEVIPAGTAVLFRPSKHDDVSLVQLVHPTDYLETRLKRMMLSGYRLNHTLFSGNLEKGVILKSRVVVLIIPRQDDVAFATTHLSQFINAPLPLTT